MMRRILSIFALCAISICQAGVPVPKEHFGFTPGDDYKLANYGQIIAYFEKLARNSDRIRLAEFGKTAHGKPMYVAFISAPENLDKLDRYREISRRLALGQATPEEARALAREGKAIVWIDSGLHASEVAPAQHSPELAYRMVSDEGEEMRRIRQNVILLQVPVINPDGLDWMAEWYRKNVGTPYESAPLPRLYQKYAGHDNNRDWFMMNLPETRPVARLLFREWFPQIVYNQHQTPPFPARLFVPPYSEPLNPHIAAPVMEGINGIGAAIKERMARESKAGVLSYIGFDAWWNGGLRSAPAFHNMHGILTETAGSYATPMTYSSKDFPERFANGMPTREPTVFYQRPWQGGTWRLRDAVDYMLTVDMAILELASARSGDFLIKAYDMACVAIKAGRAGKPFAYVVPPAQWDASSAIEMLRRLEMGGVEIQRARKPFKAGKREYPAGTYVMLTAQAFRPYLMDLMEPQKYPELRTGATGSTKRPYDVAGWTLSMQMGVTVDRIDEPFDADLQPQSGIPESTPTLDHRENRSFVAIADLLERGAGVRWASDGKILIEREQPEAYAKAAWELKRPRVAVYEPAVGHIDTGWTEWVLDEFRVPYSPVHKEDFGRGDLRARFDTIILASQSPTAILHGSRHGETPSSPEAAKYQPKVVQRPEYTGGIGLQGLANLEKFVSEGGTLLALDGATELPLQFFPLPVRNVVRRLSDGSETFYCPGSVLRITVDPANPIAFGMPKEAFAFSTGGHAFEAAQYPEFNTGEREVRSVAKYADQNLLASGWVSGEKAVLGKDVLLEARHGRGRVILFGFRPQFRGQPFGTFKLLLNAIYLGSAKAL